MSWDRKKRLRQYPPRPQAKESAWRLKGAKESQREPKGKLFFLSSEKTTILFQKGHCSFSEEQLFVVFRRTVVLSFRQDLALSHKE